MSCKRYSSQIIDERGVDLSEQSAGRVKNRVSQGVFKLIESETGQMQRLTWDESYQYSDEEVIDTSNSPINDQKIPRHYEWFKYTWRFVEGYGDAASNRPFDLHTCLLILICHSDIQIFSWIADWLLLLLLSLVCLIFLRLLKSFAFSLLSSSSKDFN